MSSLLERARARALEAKKQEKPRIRVVALCGEAPQPTKGPLPQVEGKYIVGETCPRCRKGRYFNIIKRIWEKCYRCNGDGVISEMDMAFMERRKKLGLPLCEVDGSGR